MIESKEPEINQYCHYFEVLSKDIDSLDGRPLFRTYLHLGFLDALSRSVYPSKKPHDRVTTFIKQFGAWRDAERISLLHLTQVLRIVPDPVFESLRHFATERFQSLGFAIGNKPNIDVDPPIEEVRRLWPRNVSSELAGSITLDSLQHINLFYAFRNTLIHELRTPGYGFDFDDRDEPFYHHVPIINGPDDIEETVQLVYPLRFIQRLAHTCLSALKDYLISNNVDPYQSYDFGTYWLANLNE